MTSFLNNLSNTYGIKFTEIKYHSSKGYRNKNLILVSGSNTYNLVIYKNEKNILKTIRHSNLFYKYLNKNSIFTREIVKTLNGKDTLLVNINGIRHYACLYSYIQGSTIPWESWSKTHLKTLGKTIANIHSLTLPKEALSFLLITQIESNHLNEMTKYFLNNSVSKSIKDKLSITINFKAEDFQFIFNSLEHNKNYRLLHMDLVRGNLIWNNKTLNGIIDCEKVCIGAPEFEIARTLAFLLVDCKYKTANEVYNYFFKRGYLKRIRLKNSKYLNSLMDYYLIYDFYKFLKHNPYEFLEKNEHFLRTRFILIKRKILILNSNYESLEKKTY